MDAPLDHNDGLDAMKFDHLIAAWYRRAREAQLSQYKVAAHYAAQGRRLGVATVILSALTGTALFATLQETASTRVRLILGIASVSAAVLAALHTSLGYDERARQHRASAALYGAIRREIERHQTVRPVARTEIIDIIGTLRTRIDEAAESAPDVPARFWKRAQADIKHTARPEGFNDHYWKGVGSSKDGL